MAEMGDNTQPSVAILHESISQEHARKLAALKAYTTPPASSTGSPYVRITQPASANGAIDTSSYLRLGSYAAAGSAEASLLPKLPITYSFTEVTDPGAEEIAKEAQTSPLPANRFSTQTQATQIYTTKSSTEIFSSNDGILLYTDKDLIENVVGAGRTRYGTGHSVEVTGFDGRYDVKDGQYALSAKNGVFITAGREATDTASAYAANVEITALGYIKQRAYGDLSQVTYGNSSKETRGNTAELFIGEKKSLVRGKSEDIFFGDKSTTFWGQERVSKFSSSWILTLSEEINLRFGCRLSLSAAMDVNINLVASANINIGAKVEINLTKEYKINLGNTWSWVQGDDIKYVRKDGYKFVEKSDFKKAPLNFLYLILNSVNQKMYVHNSKAADWLAELEARKAYLLSSNFTNAFERVDSKIFS